MLQIELLGLLLGMAYYGTSIFGYAAWVVVLGVGYGLVIHEVCDE